MRITLWLKHRDISAYSSTVWNCPLDGPWYAQTTNNTAKDRSCLGLTKIKGIRCISCIYWGVQFHTPNLSLLISNLAWYSWLIRMAWSSSNSPPAPCLFQLRSLRLPGTAAVGTQSMGKCETDQKRDTLAVSTGWQLGLTIGNNVVIYS